MVNTPLFARSGHYDFLHRCESSDSHYQKQEVTAGIIDPIFAEQGERHDSSQSHWNSMGRGFGGSRKRVARIEKRKGCKPNPQGFKKDKAHWNSGESLAGNQESRWNPLWSPKHQNVHLLAAQSI
jgi:hypothetical protein